MIFSLLEICQFLNKLTLIFYIFAGFCASLVLITPNLVYAVIFMVCAFISGAFAFILIGADAFGLIFIIVYIGAIAVLFLFVVMMLDLKIQNSKNIFLLFIKENFLKLIFFIMFLMAFINFTFKFKSNHYIKHEIAEDFFFLWNQKNVNFHKITDSFLNGYNSTFWQIPYFQNTFENVGLLSIFTTDTEYYKIMQKDSITSMFLSQYDKLISILWSDLDAKTYSFESEIIKQILAPFEYSTVNSFEHLIELYSKEFAPLMLVSTLILLLGMIGSITIAMITPFRNYKNYQVRRQDSFQQYNRSACTISMLNKKG